MNLKLHRFIIATVSYFFVKLQKTKPLDLEKYMIPCLSKTLFGVECLGCGFQRSLLLLLEGNFVAAFEMYPAIFTTLFFAGIIGLHFIDKSRNYKKLIFGIGILNGVFMIAGYIYKHY